MPKYIVKSPCKIKGDLYKSGCVELTKKDADPLLESGALVAFSKAAAAEAGLDTDGADDE